MKYKNSLPPKECPICYCEIKIEKNFAKTPCGHDFCFDCIAKSLKVSSKCPICRNKLAPINKQQFSQEENIVVLNDAYNKGYDDGYEIIARKWYQSDKQWEKHLTVEVRRNYERGVSAGRELVNDDMRLLRAEKYAAQVEIKRIQKLRSNEKTIQFTAGIAMITSLILICLSIERK